MRKPGLKRDLWDAREQHGNKGAAMSDEKQP